MKADDKAKLQAKMNELRELCHTIPEIDGMVLYVLTEDEIYQGFRLPRVYCQ